MKLPCVGRLLERGLGRIVCWSRTSSFPGETGCPSREGEDAAGRLWCGPTIRGITGTAHVIPIRFASASDLALQGDLQEMGAAFLKIRIDRSEGNSWKVPKS